MEKRLEPDKSVHTHIITIHGIKSSGKPLEDFSKKLQTDLHIGHVTNIDYKYLLASLNYLPWVRNILQEYVAARLATLTYKYPESRTLIIAHSNGTWMLARAIEKYYSKFRVDNVFLFGSVIETDFDWSKYPDIKVQNYIGKKDKVLLFSKWMYGMGQSGRKGFEKNSKNLKQFRFNWGHTGFYKEYILIKSFVRGVLFETPDNIGHDSDLW